MDFKELLEKYQVLMAENNNLKQEVKSLKAQLGIVKSQIVPDDISDHKNESEIFFQESTGEVLLPNINSKSDSIEKIKLFMSLFK